MTKNPDRRLGCVPGIGEVAINKHPFFAYIDWSKLEARQVRPPFQPQIVSCCLILLFTEKASFIDRVHHWPSMTVHSLIFISSAVIVCRRKISAVFYHRILSIYSLFLTSSITRDLLFGEGSLKRFTYAGF